MAAKIFQPTTTDPTMLLLLTKYLRPLAVCAAALTLVGCATVKPQAIEAKHSERLKNQTVATTTREKPSFMMTSPGNMAIGGLIGALIAQSTGNRLIAENEVEDPADAISAGLLRVLQAHQGTRQVTPAMPTTSNDPQKLASVGKGKAKFVLDVETTGWGAGYFPSAMSRYRVGYSARARLIDVETQAQIAEGGCRRETGFGDAPTYDELWANKAAIMRRESALTVQECVEAIILHMVPAAAPLAEALATEPKTATATPVAPAPAAVATPVTASAAPAPGSAPPPATSTVSMPFVPDSKPVARAAAPAAAAQGPRPASPTATAAMSMPFASEAKPVGSVAGPAPAAAPAAQSVPTAAAVPVVSPAQPAPAATAVAAAPTSASKKESRLQWLKQMRDANLITAGEYETKRQQVLSAP